MTTISVLADDDLAQIFKRLPPYDRLRVSEVCQRWYSISQDPWHEVTRLELHSSVPSESIAAIVRMCPNLTSFFCKDQQLILDDLRNITLASLNSVAYHNCSFISRDHPTNQTALPLFRSEYGQSMEELVLHDHNFGLETRLSKLYSQRLLPNSLKRLQLTGLNKEHYYDPCVYNALKRYIIELTQLRSLECLLVESKRGTTVGFTIKELESLSGLRELILPSDYYWATKCIVECARNLPKLETLVLPEQPNRWDTSDVLRNLFVKFASLRILVIPGNIKSNESRIQVPTRKRFPLGFAADPLPLLHVFVSKCAAELFRFDDSPANWLRVHPINAPFPELLEREEIAVIFGDSWIAKQIKEGAIGGIKFWRYGDNLVDAV